MLKDLIKHTKFSNKALLKPARTHGTGEKTSDSQRVTHYCEAMLHARVSQKDVGTLFVVP